MGHEARVYTKRAEPITIDDIQDRMRERGLPVTWKAAPLTGAFGAGAWISGRFIAEEQPDAQVVAARETVDPRELRELLSDAGDSLAPNHREAVSAARSSYALETDGADEAIAERMLLHLADILADVGDGVIRDFSDQQSFDRDGFRARHARVLGAG
jgi:hypothetical protein